MSTPNHTVLLALRTCAVFVNLPPSSGEASSLKRDNPLYESQEIRMEMFADVSDEEDGKWSPKRACTFDSVGYSCGNWTSSPLWFSISFQFPEAPQK